MRDEFAVDTKASAIEKPMSEDDERVYYRMVGNMEIPLFGG